MRNKILVIAGVTLALVSVALVIKIELNKFFEEIEPYGEMAIDEDCCVGI